MKHKLIPKRIGALLLCLTLLAGLLPQTAFAAGTDTGKAIQLGTSGIAAKDTVYYGTSQHGWTVLDASKTNEEKDGMFLLSASLMDKTPFLQENKINQASMSTSDWTRVEDNAPANQWQGSDAQNWCKNYASTKNFTQLELDAIPGVRKTDDSGYYDGLWSGESSLSNEQIFFLSVEEYKKYKDNITPLGDCWWLRSPDDYVTSYAGAVHFSGAVISSYVYRAWAARPAFNLDLHSVLFTSAAEGGKIPAADGGGNQSGEAAGAIFEIGDYDGNEWKLTLLDNSRNFSISDAKIEESKIDFSYSNAQTGTNEYISVVIEDNGAITHYGRILQLDGTTGSASGTASLTLPAGVTLDDDTKLYVFSEQYNSDYKTDYASAFAEVALTVDETAPVLSDGSATRDSETTATVKFTSDEAGTYYYAVVESGAAAPTITTAGAGTACIIGENTLSIDGLSGTGAKDIYIVAKDAAGNVSQPLKITIPAIYTLTVNLNGGSGNTTGGVYPAGEVVNIDAGSRSNYRFTGWTTSNGGSFAEASSASTTFTMPAADTTITANWQYNPPYIPPVKTPSEQAIDKIEDAVDGVTVKITLSTGQTRLDKEVFEALAGRDVTLEISVPGGVSWTVNGQDIPKTANLTDLNLGVDLGTSGISVDVINAVTGEYGSVQITLAHDGEFGFALTLTAPLGRGNAGLWANLYHYDEARERLTFARALPPTAAPLCA